VLPFLEFSLPATVVPSAAGLLLLLLYFLGAVPEAVPACANRVEVCVGVGLASVGVGAPAIGHHLLVCFDDVQEPVDD
jgi:hypothetical protein